MSLCPSDCRLLYMLRLLYPPVFLSASFSLYLQDYFTALEGVKLQELQMAALQRKIEEGHAKLKQQQTLYDSVKADRNTYSKNLGDATAEINEMK